jgi:hypothetical protein
MVRALLLCTTGLLTAACMAQEPLPRKGLLLGSGAIAPGFMLQQPITNIYVVGRLEYFLEERVSIRGRAAWYVDAQQEYPLLAQNSQLSFGPYFHWGSHRLDVHVGLEPGISFTQPTPPMIGLGETPLRVLPTAALGAGVTWYVWDHFHFFLEARQHLASYQGMRGGPLALHELVLSGGLGFQLRAGK